MKGLENNAPQNNGVVIKSLVVKDSVYSIETKIITDNYDLDELNYYEQGYLKGFTSAKSGMTQSDVMDSLSITDPDYIKGVEAGFKKYALSVMDSVNIQDAKEKLKESVKLYKANKSVETFTEVLKAYELIEDAVEMDKDDTDYAIIKERDDYSLGQKFSKEDLDIAEALLESDPDLEIKGEDEDGNVIIGSKTSDSIKDTARLVKHPDWKLIRCSARMNGYQVTKFGVFKNGVRVSDSKIESIKTLIGQ